LQALKRAQESITVFENFLRSNSWPLGLGASLHVSDMSDLEFDISVKYANLLNTNTPFLEKVILADIFQKVIFGKSLMDHFRTDTFALVSELSACALGLVPVTTESYCEIIDRKQPQNFKQLSIWSLRPMLYSAFLLSYIPLKLDQKKDYLKQLIQSWSSRVSNQKYLQVQISNLKEVAEKLAQNLIGIKYTVQPLPILVYAKDYKIPQEHTSLIKKYHSLKDQFFYFGGYYHSKWGQVEAEYSKAISTKKEIWIIERMPELKVLRLAVSDRIEFYKWSGQRVRFHVPSLRLMYQHRLVRPTQKLDQLNTDSIVSFLGFNPLETLL
jgi:hypothetical protein